MTNLPSTWLRTWYLALFLLCASVSAGAAAYSADAVKAAFLFRFASYVEWPDDVDRGPFVIGIAGSDPVAAQLEKLLPGMTVRGRRAESRRIVSEEDLGGVHILYIGAERSRSLRAIRDAALQRPILLVTDDKQGLDDGAVINFIAAQRNVRFEISLAAAERSRLKINSALLSVAAHVKRRPQAVSGCRDPYVIRYRPSACQVRVAQGMTPTYHARGARANGR